MRDFPPILILDLPRLPSASPTSPVPQHFPPPIIPLLNNLPISIVVDLIASLYLYSFRVVPVKERSVDFYAFDPPARDAEFNNDPVERSGVMSTGFPAIVPCSCGDKDTGATDGGFWVGEVGGGGEPFVGGGEDRGVKGGGDKI
ncbi:MAG: hypothetical protein Q9216_006805 [Gyalolechia sp. 2 TL-2023]